MPALTPTILTATRICRDRGARAVLRDVSLTIGPETRLGVVGPNGVGKSTMLRILAGLESPDAGTIELKPPTASVGYLPQEQEQRPGEAVAAYLSRRAGAAQAEGDLLAAASALAADVPGAEGRYAEALDRWGAAGSETIQARMSGVLLELGLDEAILEMPTTALSGGQKAKVDLAGVLLSRYDVTLLDEPTNDLDFDGLARLESFVSRLAGGVAVVSHDRAFLERTVTSILEVDQHSHQASLFDGGWESYLEERAAARRHAEEAYASYAIQRRRLLDRARREREWATKGVVRQKRNPRDGDKLQRSFRVERTERLAARARMTQRAVERLAPVEKPWDGWQLQYSIREAPRAGSIVAELESAVVERGSFRLGPADLEIRWAERVALSGPNGSGKTTLIDALLGRLPLVAGSRRLGPSVVVGELSQDRESFRMDRSLLDAFPRATGLALPDARALLAKFGLGSDEVDRPIASLSPGERTRVELAAFQARGVNFLVLDEPTNHLDLPAIEQLEEALAGYAGTLLIVSHDRRLLESVETNRTVSL